MENRPRCNAVIPHDVGEGSEDSLNSRCAGLTQSAFKNQLKEGCNAADIQPNSALNSSVDSKRWFNDSFKIINAIVLQSHAASVAHEEIDAITSAVNCLNSQIQTLNAKYNAKHEHTQSQSSSIPAVQPVSNETAFIQSSSMLFPEKKLFPPSDNQVALQSRQSVRSLQIPEPHKVIRKSAEKCLAQVLS
jgi:hypothetical protein